MVYSRRGRKRNLIQLQTIFVFRARRKHFHSKYKFAERWGKKRDDEKFLAPPEEFYSDGSYQPNWVSECSANKTIDTACMRNEIRASLKCIQS
jgi:hypothetical protein